MTAGFGRWGGRFGGGPCDPFRRVPFAPARLSCVSSTDYSSPFSSDLMRFFSTATQFHAGPLRSLSGE